MAILFFPIFVVRIIEIVVIFDWINLNVLDNNKKTFVEALEKANGIVTTACLSTGLPRSTYYHYYNTDPEFKEACDAAQEVAIDFVESKLMEKINGVSMAGKGEEEPVYTLPPSDTAIIFYLKTKGKKRGYVERTEVDATIKTEQPLFGDGDSK